MINPLIIFGLAFIYLILKVYLENRWAPLDDVGDDRHLADLAFACGCSVFDIFKSAGAQWNFSARKAERDFRRYLRSGHVPTYVHRYVTDHPRHRNSTYQRLIFNGGRPPYL